MAVALELPVLEVERLVAVAGGLPGEHRGGEPPRLEVLPLEAALARIVVARATADADVEVDQVDPVRPQLLQRVAAVFVGLAAGLFPRGVVGRFVGDEDHLGGGIARLRHGGLGEGDGRPLRRIGRLHRGLVHSRLDLGEHRRHPAEHRLGRRQEGPPLLGPSERRGAENQGQGEGRFTPASRAPRCSSGLPA